MGKKVLQSKSEKKRRLKASDAIICGALMLPIFGTAISRSEIVAPRSASLLDAGFIFSLLLIPLVFFGIYKLDRAIEKAVPKDGRERKIAGKEKGILRRG